MNNPDDGAVRLTPSQADVDSVMVEELRRRLSVESQRVLELGLLVRHYQGEVLDLRALLSAREGEPPTETPAGE